jgi:hypothetical protein
MQGPGPVGPRRKLISQAARVESRLAAVASVLAGRAASGRAGADADPCAGGAVGSRASAARVGSARRQRASAARVGSVRLAGHRRATAKVAVQLPMCEPAEAVWQLDVPSEAGSPQTAYARLTKYPWRRAGWQLGVWFPTTPEARSADGSPRAAVRNRGPASSDLISSGPGSGRRPCVIGRSPPAAAPALAHGTGRAPRAIIATAASARP